MSTKKLARELGIIRKRSQNKESNQSKRPGKKQYFSYLIIIDFESTCWREKNNYGQEIIEFPAVLLNTSNGEVESEFHTYVQPQEHPVLSEFCTELTGITQTQVEAGVPLAICLSRFTRWLHSLQQEKGVAFLRDGKAPSSLDTSVLLSPDWDLGVCLLYECKRKQICKPEVLNSWIDLRATYKLFYSRKPKGLNGALQDLGIEFSGREHSGLDDARNTARLAWRMMTDGCFMKITKSLDRAPLISKPLFPSNPANNDSSNPSELSNTNAKNGSRKQWSENSRPEYTAKPPTDSTMPAHPTRHVSMNQNPGTYVNINHQSLVTPKTVLDDLSSRQYMGDTNGPMMRQQGGTTRLTGSSPSPEAAGLVLVSTTMSVHADVLPRQLNFDLEASEVDWTDGVVLPEMEESGSYDDVVLEEEGEGQNSGGGCDLDVSTNSSFCRKEPGKAVSLLASSALLFPASSAAVAPVGKSKQTSTISTPLAVVKNQPPVISDDACFKMPTPISASTRVTHRPVLRPFINKTTPNASHSSIYRSTPSCSAFNDSLCNMSSPTRFTTNVSLQKTTSPFCSTIGRSHYAAPNSSVSNHSLCNATTLKGSVHKITASRSSVLPSPLPQSNSLNGTKITTTSKSFTIYQDIESQCSTSTSTQTSNRGSFSVPPSVLSSRTNQSRPTVSRAEEAKKVTVTSPLCGCGRRAKRLTAGNGGPNHGRGFYCCPVRRSGPGANAPPKKGCGFFKWESALLALLTPGPFKKTSFSRSSATLVKTLR